MIADPDVRAPLAALVWLARLDNTGPLTACAVCHRSTAWRIPGAAPGGADLGLHPPCIPSGLDTGLLADARQAAGPAPAPAPARRKGAYARHWGQVA